MNDLWQYNLTSNTWMHVSGNQSKDTHSDYNVPYPGGVYHHSMILDGSNHLYVFGGDGFDADVAGIVLIIHFNHRFIKRYVGIHIGIHRW